MKARLGCRSKQCHLKITAAHSAMGKYTRKAKATAAVASPSCLGVSTRARTLALQRLGSSADAPPPPDGCFLELRSRRLEKRMQEQRPANARRECGCGDARVGEFVRQGSIAESIDGGGLGIEASFGENNLDFEFVDVERSTGESTPCSSIKAANIITTPGSTTKQTCSSPAAQITRDNTLAINAPSENELEEFFTHAEDLLHCHYADKYNFDFSKGLPLPGRYEWAAVGSLA